jgi:hypothetical protein
LNARRLLAILQVIQQRGRAGDRAHLIQPEHHDRARYGGDRSNAALRGHRVRRPDHFLCNERVREQGVSQLLGRAVAIFGETDDPQDSDAQARELRIRTQLIEQPLCGRDGGDRPLPRRGRVRQILLGNIGRFERVSEAHMRLSSAAGAIALAPRVPRFRVSISCVISVCVAECTHGKSCRFGQGLPAIADNHP